MLQIRFVMQKLFATLYDFLPRFFIRRLQKFLSIPPPSPQSPLFGMVWVFIEQEGITGDYLEFGTSVGRSFICAYQNAQKRGHLPDIRFFAFDSFAGLPPHENEGRFKAGQDVCSKQEFLQNLKLAKVDLAKVKIVEGWYSETLTDTTKEKTGLSAASVINIDCDIYESTKQALDFVTSLLQDGTVIIFNDWWCYKGRSDKGERKACNEWLKEHPNITLHEFWKQGYGDTAFVVQLD